MKTLLLVSLLWPSILVAGGTVGNGGDTILCHGLDSSGPLPPPPDIVLDPEKPPVGTFRYSLDYIIARRAGMLKDAFDEPRDWTESRGRIENILRRASPRLAESFAHFAESADQIDGIEFLRSEESKLPKRTWSQWHTLLHFRIIDQYVMPECVFRKEVNGVWIGAFIFQRSILRTIPGPNSVLYEYNSVALKDISHTSPLQYSFILVHEWLWDFTKSKDINRQVNAFLHSREAAQLDRKEIKARLRNLGMKF